MRGEPPPPHHSIKAWSLAVLRVFEHPGGWYRCDGYHGHRPGNLRCCFSHLSIGLFGHLVFFNRTKRGAPLNVIRRDLVLYHRIPPHQSIRYNSPRLPCCLHVHLLSGIYTASVVTKAIAVHSRSRAAQHFYTRHCASLTRCAGQKMKSYQVKES